MAIELDKLSITEEDVKAEALRVIPLPMAPQCKEPSCGLFVESGEEYCTDHLDQGRG